MLSKVNSALYGLPEVLDFQLNLMFNYNKMN